jgi:hypothetical protein
MTNEELAQELADQFLIRDYTWTRGGKKFVPEPKDFLDAFTYILKNVPEGATMVGGRLVAVNADGHTDIYLHVGEINAKDS